MSVFFDHRSRHGDDEQGAIHAGRDDGSLWGFAYDRIEGVVHLTLAFTIVGGAAVIISSALFGPGAPLGGPLEKPAVAQQEKPAPAPVVAAKDVAARDVAARDVAARDVAAKEAVAPVAVVETPEPAAVKEAPAPVQQAERAPAPPLADPLLLDARPISESAAPATTASAPKPLSPPSSDMREKLVARQDAAPALAPPAEESVPPPAEASAYQAAPAPAPATNGEDVKAAAPVAPAKAEAAAPRADEGGRMAKCYLKLSGKVQNSGACRVDHAGANVIFHLPGKPLALAHDRGRVWTATLGGRSLGKVYRNKDARCWGAKGFYACENG